MNNLLVGLILLPVSKCSLVAAMFGVGWEKVAAHHRLLGTLFLLSILAHAGLMMSKWLIDPINGYVPGGALTVTTFWHNLLAYAYFQWGAWFETPSTPMEDSTPSCLLYTSPSPRD